MAYSASNIITWAKISQALAFKDQERKKYIKGGVVDDDLHIRLYVERSSLEWEYAQNPSSDYLYPMGNYVLSLCFPYLFEAQVISGATGSSVTPSLPGISYLYNVIYKQVGVDAGAPTAGTSTFTHSDLINGTDLNFLFINNVTYFLTQDFTVDYSTGTVTMLAYTWVANDRVAIPYNQLV